METLSPKRRQTLVAELSKIFHLLSRQDFESLLGTLGQLGQAVRKEILSEAEHCCQEERQRARKAQEDLSKLAEDGDVFGKHLASLAKDQSSSEILADACKKIEDRFSGIRALPVTLDDDDDYDPRG